MNQYERIVSYIYQYDGAEKGANVGYAKLEKRGNQCRFQAQIRAVALRKSPVVYCYRQLAEGIQTISAGTMTLRGNNLVWKAAAEANGLFQSDWSIEEIDGIFIDGADKIYFATTWKQDTFYLGNWRENAEEEKRREETVSDDRSKAESNIERTVSDDRSKAGSNIERTVSDDRGRGGSSAERMVSDDRGRGGSSAERMVSDDRRAGNSIERMVSDDRGRAGKEIEERDVQATEVEKHTDCIQPEEQNNSIQEAEQNKALQAICGICPFQQRVQDYGKKLLMSFPTMHPFQKGVAKACVRMDLQDIGCLPIASWSLSGNRFLLHGYSCYRHLVFAQLADGSYALGVPGVFSERDRQNAQQFGFSDFQSIGELGKQQGAFGYWLVELPESGN